MARTRDDDFSVGVELLVPDRAEIDMSVIIIVASIVFMPIVTLSRR